jgi:hypothetical protein
MKQGEYQFLPPDKKSEAALRETFLNLNKEYLTHADINIISKTLVASIKSKLAHRDIKELPSVIVECLGDSFVASLANSPNVAPEDLSPHMDRIRDAVLNQVKLQMGETVDIYLISKTIADWSAKICEAGDNLITKQDVNSLGSVREDHEVALARLNHLRDEGGLSPYVAHTLLSRIKRIDKENVIDEVHRRLNITALDVLIKDKPRPPLKQVLDYFLNGLEGLDFLVSQGFILTDNAVDNFAVNKETDAGTLFDLDGLLLSGTEVSNEEFINLSRLHYIPPEREDRNDPNKKPIREAEMVYECGVTLGRFLEIYEDDSLSNLSQAMTTQNPDSRPDLKAVITSLRQFLS